MANSILWINELIPIVQNVHMNKKKDLTIYIEAGYIMG